MVRNFVEFKWSGVSKSTPPGREVVEFVRATMSTDADHIDATPSLRSEYGWEFEVSLEKTKLLIVVQEVGCWLVIVHRMRGFLGWLHSRDSDSVLLRACRSIHSALEKDGAFSDARWYTTDEFTAYLDSGAAGSPVPG